MLDAADLPDDVAALKAMLIAAQVREAAKDVAIASKDEHIARKDERIERLEKLVAAFKQAAFGRKSEKTDPDQFDLALEDLETAMAVIHAEDEADAPAANRIAKSRAINRGSLPKHLPRIEEVIEPESLICGCGGCLHYIGEDVSERLDVIPAQFRVIVTRRPKYACRACTDGIVQAAAPARLIPAGLPTEATVAHVLVSKYADHLPLYRQAQIMSRQGIDLDRSTLADWVGRAAFELRPVFDALIGDLKRSTKLFMDETRAPVLDPGSRKTKTGYFWALARDDRPWGGGAPPGVAFTYAPGRGGIHAERILQGFSGILQVDGYAGYNRLIAPERVGLPIAGLTRGASWWRSPATGQHRLPRMASSGLVNCIGSRPSCEALTRRLDLPDDRNAQRHSSQTCIAGSSITAHASQRSPLLARHWPTSPNTGMARRSS